MTLTEQAIEALDEFLRARERFGNSHPESIKARAKLEASIVRAAKPSAPLPNIDVDVTLRTIFELCEATVEAPEITPKNEHERGFDRGRRFEAKRIQKTMGQWFQLVFSGSISESGNV